MPGCLGVLLLVGLGGCGGGSSGSSTPAGGDDAAPTTPAGLTALATAPSRIELSWLASTDSGGSGIAGYRIFRDDSSTALATVTATSYADTSVTPGTRYSYVVRAVDNAGNVSAPTQPVEATTPTAPTGGLDTRPSNTSCLAPERGGAGGSVIITRAFERLTFVQPLAMMQPPGDASRWYIVERGGRVRVFANDPAVATASTFVDLSAQVNTSGEGGLLGMAFHPDFGANGRVFLSYTRNGTPLQSVVARYVSPDGGTTLDPGSAEILLTVDQPYSNHNGGQIGFGPDGYLYIGLGDGGSGGDPQDNAQNTRNLLGAMLRINVDDAAPYTIPAGNPFAGNPPCLTGSTGTACPEIFAWGLRNPWRWSFDRATGELWLGDVGENAWEEIDRVELGGNYGWRCREGAHPYDSSGICPAGLIDPVAEYAHRDPQGASIGNSVTGGYVYRGNAVPALAGRYVFGDFGSGRIWQLLPDDEGGLALDELLDTSFSIASFGQGADGEIYVLDIASGQLHRLEQGGNSSSDPVAERLSETGCFDGADPAKPAAGLVPYAPNAPFWSDGADQQRWLAIPDDSAISLAPGGDFDFPPGSVLAKHFRLAGRLIETRLLMRHPDGEWAGYTYAWNEAGFEATRVRGGASVSIGSQVWIYPSESQCLECHTAAAGRSLGLEIAQLNGDLRYPSTGRTANQLSTLDRIGLLSPPAGEPSTLPALADPFGGAPVAERARAYLHTNCAQCHRSGGPTPSDMNLRHDTPLTAMNACGVRPSSGDLGIADALLIAPGDAARSMIVERMRRRDAHGMPPLGSNVVDADGVALVSQWIDALTGC